MKFNRQSPIFCKLRRYYLELKMKRTGSFTFFGNQIYSPQRSVLFSRWSQHGYFEPEVMEIIRLLSKPDTFVFDVGANIGMMSAYALYFCPNVQVISIECSPSTLPYLRKTVRDSQYRDRWHLVEKAVGCERGSAKFFTSGADLAAYDGLRDTKRGGNAVEIEVEVDTIDSIWKSQGKPKVSLLKIDIEGGEYGALNGANELLSECKPHVVLEWNQENLAAYQQSSEGLFDFPDFSVRALPSLQIVTPDLLPIFMARGESFLMSPV